MIKKALRIGQLITNAHPSDVRLLFKAYNIKAEPTGKSIVDAYLVYGKPFLMELFNIGYKSVNPVSSLDGATVLTTLEYNKLSASEKAAYDKAASDTAKAKASTWTSISGWFDSAGGILTGAKSVYEGIASIFSGNKAIDTGTTNADAAIQAAFMQAKLDAIAAENANNTKTYLLIGAGLLVAVLVGIMFLKRK
ncbi:MAG: hypothetical protein Q8R96_11680 [Bacteroidota bacterium]|nr:hypothetical protein [Bacteroidota bacterium]